jgi:MFS family permease
VLGGVLANPDVAVPAIALLAVAQGIINALDLPARQAFLTEMVTDRADLANAIALNSTMVHTARMIGPALAGLLIYWVGPGWCFMLDGASYLAVIASLLAMRVSRRAPNPTRHGVLRELRDGLAYAWNHRPIRALLLLMALLSLAGMPALATLVPIFAEEFATMTGSPDRGSQFLGFMMAASGLGALVGAVQLARRRSIVGLGRVISTAAVVFGAALVAFSFSRSLWVSLLIIPVAGWAMLMNFASANTLLQTLADEDKRGRVMSLFTVAFIGVAPFGNLAAGWLAGHLGGLHAPGPAGNLHGAAVTLRVAGGICLAAAAVFLWKLPSIRKHARVIYEQKGLIPPLAAEQATV